MSRYQEVVQAADADTLRSALFEFACRYPPLQDELVAFLQPAGDSQVGDNGNGGWNGGSRGNAPGSGPVGANNVGLAQDGAQAGAPRVLQQLRGDDSGGALDDASFNSMEKSILDTIDNPETNANGFSATAGGATSGSNAASSELQRLLSDDTVLSIGLNMEGTISRWSRRAVEVIGYSEQQVFSNKLASAPFICKEAQNNLSQIVERAVAQCLDEGKVNFSNILGRASVPFKTAAGKLIDIPLEIRPVKVGGSMHLILLQELTQNETDGSEAESESQSSDQQQQSQPHQLSLRQQQPQQQQSKQGSRSKQRAEPSAVTDVPAQISEERPPWWQFRNRPGCIFGANKDTFDECINRRLLGLPAHYMKMVTSIVPNETVLFLFNFTTRFMFGIFVATDHGGEHESNAWCRNSDERTPFPAQIRFRIVHKFAPLIESAFSDLMEYRPNTRHFRFQLTPERTTALLERFASKPNKPAAS